MPGTANPDLHAADAREPFALTDDQVEAFDRDGLLVVHGVLSDADLQPAIDDITAMIDRLAAKLVEDGELSRDYAELPFERRLAEISRETDKAARAIWNGAMHSPGIFGVITNPRLLDVARHFCGEEVIASSVYRLRPKVPNYNYDAVPWHQDSGYTEPFCDKAMMLTVWVPLVDATAERGCMWGLPGVHKNEALLRHISRVGATYLEIPEEELPGGVESVCLAVPKGGVVLLHNRTPHVSYENKSDVVRWSMDLRYQSASLPTNAKITRLEHEMDPMKNLDKAGDVPTACYPPEADFLVSSVARPDEVIRTPEAFAALRESHMPGPSPRRWEVVGA